MAPARRSRPFPVLLPQVWAPGGDGGPLPLGAAAGGPRGAFATELFATSSGASGSGRTRRRARPEWGSGGGGGIFTMRRGCPASSPGPRPPAAPPCAQGGLQLSLPLPPREGASAPAPRPWVRRGAALGGAPGRRRPRPAATGPKGGSGPRWAAGRPRKARQGGGRGANRSEALGRGGGGPGEGGRTLSQIVSKTSMPSITFFRVLSISICSFLPGAMAAPRPPPAGFVGGPPTEPHRLGFFLLL